jgi:hypothetical protein
LDISAIEANGASVINYRENDYFLQDVSQRKYDKYTSFSVRSIAIDLRVSTIERMFFFPESRTSMKEYIFKFKSESS